MERFFSNKHVLLRISKESSSPNRCHSRKPRSSRDRLCESGILFKTQKDSGQAGM